MEAAGMLLRTARRRVGLSQAELARRAGLTQSVISAYESGARQPSLPTLARLIEATGSDLEVRVCSALDVQSIDGPLARRVREHRREIVALLESHGLTNPRLFGSAARGDDKPGSDIDLLVDVPAKVGLLGLARCQARLEALLNAPVDLVPSGDLKVSLVGDVLAEAVAL
ncbi:MAG: helix-turn-helix domain-containing protein [Actinomycetota bacterium]|nr:helix-turn-helix domain-containing protein [Actinomycetota bacterium]